MSRDRFHQTPPRCRGFSLVAAIFVLVVLSMIGAFMVTIGQIAQTTATVALQGARALQAAQAGIEWGAAQAAPPVGPSSCAALTSFSLTAAGLNGFNVDVTCGATTYREGSQSYQVFALASTATAGTFGDPAYVSRTITASVTSPNAP